MRSATSTPRSSGGGSPACGDVLVHGYFVTRMPIVWQVATTRMTGLRLVAEQIFEEATAAADEGPA